VVAGRHAGREAFPFPDGARSDQERRSAKRMALLARLVAGEAERAAEDGQAG
jgi:spore germination cell wall hydrolase CwlJ-like protein